MNGVFEKLIYAQDLEQYIRYASSNILRSVLGISISCGLRIASSLCFSFVQITAWRPMSSEMPKFFKLKLFGF